MNKNITVGTTPNSSTALSTSLVIKNGNYAMAKDLFQKNPHKKVVVTTPDGNFSIEPLAKDTTLLIPSIASREFETWVSIRETEDEFKFGPFDMNAEETNNSFSARYKNLISNEILSAKATLYTTNEMKEYEIEKEDIEKLLQKDGGSMQFEELMTAITVILENHPTVIKQGKIRNITAYDVVKILKDLLQHGISLETACHELNSWGAEFNEIILTKDKYSFFTEVAGFEIDEQDDDG